MSFNITGDPAADRVLDESPFALLAGMMLDQQYPMEHAFRGPAKLLGRLGSLSPHEVAAADPQEFATLCAQTPAIHRFPASMASRLQALAVIIEEQYDGRAERLWEEASSGAELMRRMTALPGFGKQKAQIFVALLAKQVGVRPPGWQKAVGAYAEDGYRSVADVIDAESLQKVRDFKKRAKEAAKASSNEGPAAGTT